MWVGVDGWGDSTLYQTGTESGIDSNCTTYYDAWYEVLPDESTMQLISNMTVSSGDSMSGYAYVVPSGCYAEL